MIKNKTTGRVYYSWDEALDSVVEGVFVDDDPFGRRRVVVEKGFGGVTVRIRTILSEKKREVLR
jgi:hypothetical protein